MYPSDYRYTKEYEWHHSRGGRAHGIFETEQYIGSGPEVVFVDCGGGTENCGRKMSLGRSNPSRRQRTNAPRVRMKCRDERALSKARRKRSQLRLRMAPPWLIKIKLANPARSPA